MKITIQNKDEAVKSLSDQAGGRMPIILGGLSSLDLSPDAFLGYEWQIRHFVERHKTARLVVSDDKIGVQEISPDQVLDGLRQGVFGVEAQALVTKSDERKAAHAKSLVEAEAERKAARLELHARAGL